MKELLSFRTDGQQGFVVHSHLEWKATAYVRYRCEPHWRTLLDWLEEEWHRRTEESSLTAQTLR